MILFGCLLRLGRYFNLFIGMIVQIIMGVLMIISMGVTSACGDLESRDIQIRSKAKKSITAAGCCAFLVGICVLFTHSVAADVWINANGSRSHHEFRIYFSNLAVFKILYQKLSGRFVTQILVRDCLLDLILFHHGSEDKMTFCNSRTAKYRIVTRSHKRQYNWFWIE